MLENNIILETNEMPVNNLREKAKRCDFILRIGKDHNLNLEINASIIQVILSKTYPIYLVYFLVLLRKEEYNENLFATQVNLNCYDKNSDEALAQYQLREVNSHKLYTKNINIFNLNVCKMSRLIL